MPSRPLSVAVLVELERTPAAGGHVKCWERLAESLADRSDLDLTVYVLGPRFGVDQLGRSARFVALPAVLPTRRLAGTIGGVDPTDLAPFHPGLARRLPAHDVWHLTHCFAFATTAARRAGPARRPLVASVHTDVPALARSYVDELVGRLPPALQRPVSALEPQAAVPALVRRRRDRLLRGCSQVLVANEQDRAELHGVVGAERVGQLRRGVDRTCFSPRPLRQGLLPDGQVGVLFVGRVDASKRALLAGRAVRLLRDQGWPVRLVVAGDGADAPRLRDELGDGLLLLGHVPQRELSEVYASCAALVFPSLTETVGNVVAEAMACGLPPVLPDGARTTQWLAVPGADGLLVTGDRPQDWADALRPLLADVGLRARLREGAFQTSAARHLSWAQVAEQDLLPVWCAAAAARPRR